MRNYTKSTMSHCLLALIRRFFETSRTHLLGGGWARNPPVLDEATARAISALKLRKLESVGRIIRRGRAALCQG